MNMVRNIFPTDGRELL